MARAVTTSIIPWFTHRRMLPKWAGFAVALGLAVAFWTPHFVWLVPAGFAIFFPIEYGVHRGVYHHFANRPAGKVLSKQHVAHHDAPQDLDFLFNDPRFGTVTAIALFGIYTAIGALAGVSNVVGTAAALATGNYCGFVYYEWIHLAAHRPGVTPWMPWNRALKRYHLWHHFKNEHYWFGVTTSTFDHVFGSWKDQADVPTSPTVRTLVPPEEHREWMDSVRKGRAKPTAGRAES